MKTLIGKLEGARTEPRPVIECFLPEKQPNGIGLVIFPGGGYQGLAKHEGRGYAERFSKEGIACFVVTYRLSPQGHKHPAMLEDALSAISAVRGHAAELGIAPDKIGVMGSSAGGHLAAHTLVSHGRYESEAPRGKPRGIFAEPCEARDAILSCHSSSGATEDPPCGKPQGFLAKKGKISLRPDFGILCYPVITMDGEYYHKGCRTNLLGENPPAGLIDEVALERHVSSQTSPCFIWATAADPVVPVEHSILFASALRKHGVPFELHIYQKGRHGLGLNTDLPWAQECLRWLKEIAP